MLFTFFASEISFLNFSSLYKEINLKFNLLKNLLFVSTIKKQFFFKSFANIKHLAKCPKPIFLFESILKKKIFIFVHISILKGYLGPDPFWIFCLKQNHNISDEVRDMV